MRVRGVVAVEADGPAGPVGIGEGYPDDYYGDTPETMAAVAPRLLDALAGKTPPAPAPAAARSPQPLLS